jgi:putative flippase GtrA
MARPEERGVMRRWNPVQLATYLLVILISTGLDVGCVLLLRQLLPLLVAVLSGFLANVLSGYLLSRRFVFLRATARHASASWRFGVLVGLNVAVGVFAVTFLVAHGLPYIAVRLLSSGLLVPTNYLVMRSWVFVEA